jgi:polyribonucleotide nucleotidyltransferase
MVKVINVDKTGKIRLSRKQALADMAAQAGGAPAPAPSAPGSEAKA